MCFSADPDQYAKKRYILVVFQWEGGGGGGPDPLPPPLDPRMNLFVMEIWYLVSNTTVVHQRVTSIERVFDSGLFH